MNKVIQGDCIEEMKKLKESSVDIIVTDPPYNLGKNYGEDFDDNKEEKVYWEWMNKVCKELYRIIKKEKGFLYISHSDKGIFSLKPLLEKAGFKFVQILYWVAKNGYGQRNKTRWSYRVEPILFMVTSEDYELGSGKGQEWYCSYFEVPRPQSNFKEGRCHPTQKPVKLYRQIISRTPGKLIIDPFLGSGTTGIVCKYLGRDFIGIDINKKYIDISIKRILNTQKQKKL